MAIEQLSGRRRFRDLIDIVCVQQQQLYHLGSAELSRSNLSRMNEDKLHELYQALFFVLLKCCQSVALRQGFRSKNKFCLMDAIATDVCISVFSFVAFCKAKAEIKFRIAKNHKRSLPNFSTVTEARIHKVNEKHRVDFVRGSNVALDRRYTDNEWYESLADKSIFFIAQLKSNATNRFLKRREVDRSKGVTSDHTIAFTGVTTSKRSPKQLRCVRYRDSTTGKRYEFLSNKITLSPGTIAAIYKSRWQIELFFNWIKILSIKTFIGTSKNAVITQIWVAICFYLLIAYPTLYYNRRNQCSRS